MLSFNEKQSHSPKIDVLVQYSSTKWLTQELWGCLFLFIILMFIYSILLAKCYVFAQMIVMVSLVWEIFIFFICNILFLFYLIIWWGFGIASESKLEVFKNNCFWDHNCFYYFLFLCLIFFFYYYSNIPYNRK
jgi:hypothetical protein